METATYEIRICSILAEGLSTRSRRFGWCTRRGYWRHWLGSRETDRQSCINRPGILELIDPSSNRKYPFSSPSSSCFFFSKITKIKKNWWMVLKVLLPCFEIFFFFFFLSKKRIETKVGQIFPGLLILDRSREGERLLYYISRLNFSRRSTPKLMLFAFKRLLELDILVANSFNPSRDPWSATFWNWRTNWTAGR